ncbi:pyridoxal biosynthesis lyase PdxS [Allocatelliglobosispora scoriae]|uniref:Pyridoxal biosynthesis lyase PdxS n=1 Tax=Allocatelliglobosispora scoriae TaxID=643052 RepID=A0A841BM58_9ACTN|nr:pyridoxal biosynthesis lyase PdxS [Allocatelliglobosispora scoriae]
MIAKVPRDPGEAAVGIDIDDTPQSHRLAECGW